MPAFGLPPEPSMPGHINTTWGRMVVAWLRMNRLIAGDGVSMRRTRNGTVVSANGTIISSAKTPPGPFFISFADDSHITVTAGAVDGKMVDAVTSDSPLEVSDGDLVYVLANYASPYGSAAPFDVGILADKGENIPVTHDTREVIPLGRIVADDSDPPNLSVERYAYSGVTTGRRRNPVSLEVTRRGGNFVVSAGKIMALTNSSPNDVAQPVPETTLPLQQGTIVLKTKVTYTFFTNPSSPTFVFTETQVLFALDDGVVLNDNQGLFVDVPEIKLPAIPVTTTPGGKPDYALAPLDPSSPDPTSYFYIALADTAVAGNDYVITHRHRGDVLLPLNILWRLPIKGGEG